MKACCLYVKECFWIYSSSQHVKSGEVISELKETGLSVTQKNQHSIFHTSTKAHSVLSSVFPRTQKSKNMFCLVFLCCGGRPTQIRNRRQAGRYKLRPLGCKVGKIIFWLEAGKVRRPSVFSLFRCLSALERINVIFNKMSYYTYNPSPEEQHVDIWSVIYRL